MTFPNKRDKGVSNNLFKQHRRFGRRFKGSVLDPFVTGSSVPLSSRLGNRSMQECSYFLSINLRDVYERVAIADRLLHADGSLSGYLSCILSSYRIPFRARFGASRLQIWTSKNFVIAHAISASSNGKIDDAFLCIPGFWASLSPMKCPGPGMTIARFSCRS